MICAVAKLAAEFYEMSGVELICINLSESHLRGREGVLSKCLPHLPQPKLSQLWDSGAVLKLSLPPVCPICPILGESRPC